MRAAGGVDTGGTKHVAATNQSGLADLLAALCLHCVLASCYSGWYTLVLLHFVSASSLTTRNKHSCIRSAQAALLWFQNSFFASAGALPSLLQHCLNACVCVPSLGAELGQFTICFYHACRQ
jgi:hypothetical protein